jgi:hypothetical protein
MTTDELKTIASGDATIVTKQMERALATRLLAAESEIARLKAKHEPVDTVHRYWAVKSEMSWCLKTVGLYTICEEVRNGTTRVKVGNILDWCVCSITEAEYEAAKKPAVVKSCENCGGPEYPCDSPGCDGWNKPAVKRIEESWVKPNEYSNNLDVCVKQLQRRVEALENERMGV